MPEIERRWKKRLPVEVLLWDRTNAAQVDAFIGDETRVSWEAGTLTVWNDQEEAWIAVPPGHRVVRGTFGEFYPMSPGAYEMTTEAETADGESRQVSDLRIMLSTLIDRTEGSSVLTDDERAEYRRRVHA